MQVSYVIRVCPTDVHQNRFDEMLERDVKLRFLKYCIQHIFFFLILSLNLTFIDKTIHVINSIWIMTTDVYFALKQASSRDPSKCVLNFFSLKWNSWSHSDEFYWRIWMETNMFEITIGKFTIIQTNHVDLSLQQINMT